MKDRDYILGTNIARLYTIDHLLSAISSDKTIKASTLRSLRRRVSAMLTACHTRLEKENDAAHERREAREAEKAKIAELRSKLRFKERTGPPYEGLAMTEKYPTIPAKVTPVAPTVRPEFVEALNAAFSDPEKVAAMKVRASCKECRRDDNTGRVVYCEEHAPKTDEEKEFIERMESVFARGNVRPRRWTREEGK